MWTKLICFCLVSSAFGQAPILTFQKLRNVDPPTIRLLWNAVSTPTPDYDVYQTPAVSGACPAASSPVWVKIADNLATTQLDVLLPIIVNGHGTKGDYCWYVQGYVNGVATAPSNLLLAWRAAVGYMYPQFVKADPITGGCPTSFNYPSLSPYPFSSGGTFTITQALNGVKSVLPGVEGPIYSKNAAGQIVGVQYEFQVNVLDTATYTGTVTYPDGYTYSFPMFTNWASVESSADDYDVYALVKLQGSGTICRRQLYQLDEPAN